MASVMLFQREDEITELSVGGRKPPGGPDTLMCALGAELILHTLNLGLLSFSDIREHRIRGSER